MIGPISTLPEGGVLPTLGRQAQTGRYPPPPSTVRGSNPLEEGALIRWDWGCSHRPDLEKSVALGTAGQHPDGPRRGIVQDRLGPGPHATAALLLAQQVV